MQAGAAMPSAPWGDERLRVLFVGDIVGKSGRRILRQSLPDLRARHHPDALIVNGENAAGGAGITPAVAEEIAALGADVITLGNHTWDHRDLIPAIDNLPKLLRPANYPPGTPGRGSMVFRTAAGVAIGVISLMGRTFSPTQLDDPFRGADHEIELVQAEGARVIIVDFHADATAEKQSLGWYLDGRVTAVIGTHTHVQTADAVVLPGGTAYITDVGMTGPWLSVLGVDPQTVVERFLTQMPSRFAVARGPAMFNGLVLDADDATGRARAVTPLFWREPADADVPAEEEEKRR